MKTEITITKRNHYSDYVGGSFWPFMFWCSNSDRRYWTIVGCGSFVRDGKAVMDNFGNLVEVV